MPTGELESLLSRDLSRAAAREIIDSAGPLLRELVNFGLGALARCEGSAAVGPHEARALLHLYRHMIEMTDGIELLVAGSAPVPAQPLLRSSFTALISLEYILESGAQLGQRSLSWLVGYVHRRIGEYEMLLPTTNRGSRLRRALRDDRVVPPIIMPPEQEVQAAIDNLRRLLTQPDIELIEREHRRMREARRGRGGALDWYNLFSGPANLEQLANRVGRPAAYEILYRAWSSLTHAEDYSQFLTQTAAGEPAIRPLRGADDLPLVVLNAASFMLGATWVMIRKFRPGEDLRRWYVREVQARYLSFTGA